jgi:ribosome-interacting GTPase 1
MDVEIQITVNIIDIEEMLQRAIENKHPQQLIKMYKQMIADKQDELKMLQYSSVQNEPE